MLEFHFHEIRIVYRLKLLQYYKIAHGAPYKAGVLSEWRSMSYSRLLHSLLHSSLPSYDQSSLLFFPFFFIYNIYWDLCFFFFICTYSWISWISMYWSFLLPFQGPLSYIVYSSATALFGYAFHSWEHSRLQELEREKYRLVKRRQLRAEAAATAGDL